MVSVTVFVVKSITDTVLVLKFGIYAV